MSKLGNKPYPLYNVENIKTLCDLVDLCENKYSSLKAFWFADSKAVTTEISYGRFASDVKSLASYLDVTHKGKHIGIYGENCYEWILAYMAAVYCGAVAVPIDKELDAVNAEKRLRDADCVVVFRSKAYQQEVKQMNKEGLTVYGFEEIPGLIKNGEKRNENYGVTPGDLAAIVYTSGTSGESKGVMLTHENLASDAVDSSRNLFVPSGTILLLPLHHSFGMMSGVFCQLLMGYPVFINQSLRYLQRDIMLAQPRFLTLVPLLADAIYKNIFDQAEKKGKTRKLNSALKLSKFLLGIGIDIRRLLFFDVIKGLGGELEMVITGGSSIRREVFEGLDAFGIKMINGYGITECSPIVATTRNKHYNFPSVGCVVPGTEAVVDNDSGNEDGEILIKGPIVFSGYYKDTEATEAAFSDGWFRTGDLGHIDEHGFLSITGRLKNLIITQNGENVSAEELEDLILMIGEVNEVVVRAEDDVIIAEIYSEKGIGEEKIKSDIDKAVREINHTLPAYKQISRIEFRDIEFPKTTTRKIKR